MKVEAIGTNIKVFVDDMQAPMINVMDSTYTNGEVGIRAFAAAASFDNIYLIKVRTSNLYETYEYDFAGRLYQINENGMPVFRFEYDKNGNLISKAKL